MVGQAAEAVDDRGGFPAGSTCPATSRSPAPIPGGCRVRRRDLLRHAGRSRLQQRVHQLFGAIDARRIVPIFVNALSHPRPTFRRCRRFGEAVGRFAATLGKRVAFVGSGGLSHETGEVFPQVFEAPMGDARVPDSRRVAGELSREQWRRNLDAGLAVVNGLLIQRTPGIGNVKPEWDQAFLRMLDRRISARSTPGRMTRCCAPAATARARSVSGSPHSPPPRRQVLPRSSSITTKPAPASAWPLPSCTGGGVAPRWRQG